MVELTLTGANRVEVSHLLESVSLDSGLQIDPSLLQVSSNQVVRAVVSNPTGLSMSLWEGHPLGEASAVDLVVPDEAGSGCETTRVGLSVKHVQTEPVTWRKKQLVESIGALEALALNQRQELLDFLLEHHHAFALEEHE